MQKINYMRDSDISHLKIYFDENENFYRTKVYCQNCGEFIECLCFDGLKEAVNHKNDIYCSYCYLKLFWMDDDIYESDILKTNSPKLVKDMVNFCFNESQSQNLKNVLRRKINHGINNLSNIVVHNTMIDFCDDVDGMVC